MSESPDLTIGSTTPRRRAHDGVQLIAYVDRFGGTVAATSALIAERYGDAVTGVHLLPFFTPYDGADAGFDPRDHTTPDPRLGTWADVRDAAGRHDLTVDVIVNHVSSGSEVFREYVEHGDAASSSDLFLTYSSVFPRGATEEDLTAIYRPRPGLPFTTYRIDGRPRLVWTTFTPQQVDIDVFSVSGRRYLDGILDRLAEAGVSTVRLDAAGYAVKRAGGSSFMMPETFDFIAQFSDRAHARGMTVLVEIHSYYRTQIEIANRVDLVYDFALPPLVLHALFTGDVVPLARWIEVRPHNCVTVLDTHDGIGVIDVGPDQLDRTRLGLLAPEQVDDLVDRIHENTRGASRSATGAAASNLDLYQVNASFHSAMGSDDEQYLLARAIQFLLPGTPQVYYVGALAGGDDLDLLAQTRNGRDINRHLYTEDEIDAAFDRPVVRALRVLMRLRSTHPAFAGDFVWRHHGGLTLEWRNGRDRITLEADPAARTRTLRWTENGSDKIVRTLLDLSRTGPDRSAEAR